MVTSSYSIQNGGDNSCTLAQNLKEGCTCREAVNFDSSAVLYDGSCVYPTTGCTYPDAWNYHPDAQLDDGSCWFGPLGKLGRQVNSLENTVSDLQQQLSALRETVARAREKNERLNAIKQNKAREFRETMDQLEEETQEAILERNASQSALSDCTKTKLRNLRERERFQRLFDRCQGLDTNGTSNNPSRQRPVRIRKVQYPKRSVEFKSTPSSSSNAT